MSFPPSLRSPPSLSLELDSGSSVLTSSLIDSPAFTIRAARKSERSSREAESPGSLGLDVRFALFSNRWIEILDPSKISYVLLSRERHFKKWVAVGLLI